MRQDELTKYYAGIGETAGIPWKEFSGESVLVTGATGLVGFNVIATLLVNAARCEEPPTVYALVRNAEKARKRFADLPSANLHFIVGDVTDEMPADIRPTYIIHAAARTDSAGMVEEPLSVIGTALDGTRNIMEFARKANPRMVVYVSSMEVYGAHDSDALLTEHDYGTVDPLSIRSSYPESKKMSENICCSYHSQLDVPVCIARLAQTFGVGIPATDQRVFAYFARCAKFGRDIELATEGTSTRMYVSAGDAAAALLILLAKGNPGEAYNVANKTTYCSIREMAELVRATFASTDIAIRVKGVEGGKYPPTHHLKLDVSKVEALGWQPTQTLEDMFASILPDIE